MGEESLNNEQPAPTEGTGPDCWQLVLEDMAERRWVGIDKYKMLLRPDNGRDGLVDAYQEVLDLAVYLRQAVEQRKAAEATQAETLKAFERIKRALARARGEEWAQDGRPEESARELAVRITALVDECLQFLEKGK